MFLHINTATKLRFSDFNLLIHFLSPKTLISKTKHLLQKETMTTRKLITYEEKLTITLRFLATGESYKKDFDVSITC